MSDQTSKRRKNGVEAVIGRIRAENTHRRYDMPSRKTKKSTPVDIMVKPQKKTKDQEKSLKAATEKSHVTFKELREMYS